MSGRDESSQSFVVCNDSFCIQIGDGTAEMVLDQSQKKLQTVNQHKMFVSGVSFVGDLHISAARIVSFGHKIE